MREHHSLDRSHELVGSNLAELLDAYLYIPHANLSDFVFFISQALDHYRDKLWEIVDKFVKATCQE